MTRWNSLHDFAGPLVVDTSVLINLCATGKFEELLAALPGLLVIVGEVLREFEAGQEQGAVRAGDFSAWAKRGMLALAALGEAGQRHFDDLTGGSAEESLDDGEAAAIACALKREGAIATDDRKGLRICRERFPRLPAASTMDLLTDPRAETALGRKGQAAAVYRALRLGRMRVPEEYYAETVALIGPQRARRCPSLPAQVRAGGKRGPPLRR